MNADSYKNCLDKLFKLGRFGIKLELDTISNILKLLNSPQKNYKTIHIAGTNGKGSIGTYISSILIQAGYRTGFYTSPHLIKFNERFSINGIDVSDAEIVQAYQAVNKVDIGKRKATFFEIATAMAFYIFNKNRVEFAVIETGMGGRFDATNILTPEISVISNLSIEHTDYLGNTIKALAREKAGIIKLNKPVVTGVIQPSGIEFIKTKAKEKSAPLYIYKKNFSTRKAPNHNRFSYKGIFQELKNIETPLKGDHQRDNTALALAALELLSVKRKDNDKQIFTESNVRKGLKKTKWPGRLDYVLDKPCVIIDGAHNQHASKILSDYLRKNFEGVKLTSVIGILDDKPYESMLKNLVYSSSRIIFTKAKTGRSIDPLILKKATAKFSNAEIIIMEDVGKACAFAINTSKESDAVCIAGSLYVAGEAKEKIDNEFRS
ncbi:MAG: bifunctional folylpolyglutamate synthase/dihydrofolate synthase [Desulfobacteraceae bacterium]|nr:bifunctional folylpolyglutamate synthase/dihydrofolate synthase [Desulfobacteraceae bacterium]